MKRLLSAVALAAALSAGGVAQAAVITFNAPNVIVLDSSATVATYTEAGYKIVGAAAAFGLNGDAPGAEVLVGGNSDFDTNPPTPIPFSLMSSTGAAFALLAFDYGFFDLGGTPGTLTVTGLLNGAQVATRNFALGGQTHFDFSSIWRNVTEVRFSGTSLFALDNISAVPEPGTLALTTSALLVMAAGMGFVRRRRQA